MFVFVMTRKSTLDRVGFTLIELLLVVAIIATLATILIVILNPAEMLKRSRDSQRLSDLTTLKSAIALYIVNSSTPILGGNSNGTCKTGQGGGNYSTGDAIYYSLPADTDITDTTLDGQSADEPSAVQSYDPAAVDGTGWIPIDFTTMSGGSPISNLPLDPVNSIEILSAVTTTDLVYRYACNATTFTFEINAQLESQAFASDDDKRRKDGGNNHSIYEVGSNLRILGVTGF